MGSPRSRGKPKRVQRRKALPRLSNAELLFTIQFLTTQLQAMYALAETGHELATKDGGFAAPAIWDALMTSMSAQMEVLGKMSVEWQSCLSTRKLSNDPIAPC
jgi:hypothetical protein